MLFGLPWFAIIAIIAIVGGLTYAYKEQELKVEAQSRGSAREIHELRQIVHNLKSRIENLEAIAAEDKGRSAKEADNLGSIEIDEEDEMTQDASATTRQTNRN